MELAGWTPTKGSGRRDGIPPHAYPRRPDLTAFAGRDYADHARTGYATGPPSHAAHPALGLVTLLNTRLDQPSDWLRAGQGLQRVLLHATAHQVAAAFHTQPLELPGLRQRVRQTVAGGGCPQLILRLGLTAKDIDPTPRRPARDVLVSMTSTGP